MLQRNSIGASLQLRRRFLQPRALHYNSDGLVDASSQLRRAPSASLLVAARRPAFNTSPLHHQWSADGAPVALCSTDRAQRPRRRFYDRWSVADRRQASDGGATLQRKKKLQCSIVDVPREDPLQPRRSSNDSGGAPFQPRACSIAATSELRRPGSAPLQPRWSTNDSPTALHRSACDAPRDDEQKR
uniref:Uncharacterized protein n=1 Tax=Aegilops tauschii subsp. strangulata TaxID=200361 RepID=A0A453TA67_AEGTS